ncbi:hypothetical protein [Anaerosacchariphilus polymeriproducens]|uniref:Uncharacterized protein n=1 Tax=Anaerosacchariphilus polymeriproducens TaxID=1812858 RepID=A0A371AV43_9FIRM|nr:hypothetical protein [Anaerosacchariphilus polymeriproducens]RDU23436.1 hypothetical protein DWV06_09520 [Anaerosacchariphilus polymeriproducens]
MSKIIWQIRDGIRDFLKNFINVRLIVFIVLQIFIMHVYLYPIKKFALSASYPVSTWVLPFLMKDIYFRFFFIAGVMYFYSKIPFMQSDQIYQIIRRGRIKWALGKIIGIILSGFFLMLLEVFLSAIVLLPSVMLEAGWGKVLYTLALTDACEKYHIKLDFSYKIMDSYTPFQGLGVLILVGGFVLSFIGLFMFAVSLYISRLCAVVAAMFFAVFSIMAANISYIVYWIELISPISWMDINVLFGNGNEPTVKCVIAVMVIVISILTGLILIKIRKIDFCWNKEE